MSDQNFAKAYFQISVSPDLLDTRLDFVESEYAYLIFTVYFLTYAHKYTTKNMVFTHEMVTCNTLHKASSYSHPSFV